MISQPICSTFTKPTVDNETIVAWKSKGLSDESIKPPTEPGNSPAPKLKLIHNSKIAVEFKGSYMKQEKVTFSYRKVVNFFIDY